MSMLKRRQVLAGGLGAGILGAAGLRTAEGSSERPVRTRAVRLAHITDCHVNGDSGSDRGLALCMEHIATQSEAVDFIANTGDSVMCVNAVDEASARKQWGIVKDGFKRISHIPMIHAIGNHDLWGWQPSGEDSRRATGWAVDALGMPRRFYRHNGVDAKGWTFISLDGIFGSYTGKLDEEQVEFLEKTLAEIPATMFVCILTHIPIISACGFFDGNRFKNGQWTMPGSWMHEDAAKLKDLFARYRNVKLCLSGHMHQLDRIDFQGVTYLCSGAVSASWWGGKYYDCNYGYSLIDLYDDGTLETRYVGYGWPK